MKTTTGNSGGRPMIMGTHGVVTSGHYLATQIGIDILKQGGNVFDAAAAVGFALAVVQPHQNGIGGEVPVLIRKSGENKVYAISGNGVAPRAATIDAFRKLEVAIIPGDGFLPALVPPVPATWLLVLECFGTMRLCDVLKANIDLAENGFPMYGALYDAINTNANRFRKEWPSSAKTYLPGGNVPPAGSVFKQPDLGDFFRKLCEAESGAANRQDGLRAAKRRFYEGDIADTIIDFTSNNSFMDATGAAHAGLISKKDFAGYSASIENAATTSYKGIDVYKCGTWTQGPVLLQCLNLLECFDLAAMGHNSTGYIHAMVECMKLAYADREFSYGDPKLSTIPLEKLLSKEYAKKRSALVDAGRASMELSPGLYKEAIRATSVLDVNEAFARAAGGGHQGDTTKLEIADPLGNVVSATPSGGWLPSSPVIPGLGFPLGTRGQMFSLVHGHPNALEPGKRPRTTLTPGIALKQDSFAMGFGSPGGDAQDQWALQFFLNVVEFGMSLQEAIEAPTFCSLHWPSSFYPRKADPGKLCVEGRMEQEVAKELLKKGHIIRRDGNWSGGNTLAAMVDAKSHACFAGASPRYEAAYAAGW